jgi:hypothetical protein
VLGLLFWTLFKKIWVLFSPFFKVLDLIQLRNFNYYNEEKKFLICAILRHVHYAHQLQI